MQSALVITAYRIPVSRVVDWLRWNSQPIERMATCGMIVYCVCDVDTADLTVPWYMRMIPVQYEFTPDDPFCLSWTSNVGIRSAISGGAQAVIKSDPDIYWPSNTLRDTVQAIGRDCGICPLYMMSVSIDAARDRPCEAIPWNQTRGTIGLHADVWASTCGYDERQRGYGSEDGDMYARASRQCDIIRAPSIYHIAHVAGKPQHRRARDDQWCRGTINPARHDHNLPLRGTWANAQWGSYGGPQK